MRQTKREAVERNKEMKSRREESGDLDGVEVVKENYRTRSRYHCGGSKSLFKYS